MTPPDNPTSSGRQGDAERTSLFRPAGLDGSDHSASPGQRTAVDEPSTERVAADEAGTDSAGGATTGDSAKRASAEGASTDSTSAGSSSGPAGAVSSGAASAGAGAAGAGSAGAGSAGAGSTGAGSTCAASGSEASAGPAGAGSSRSGTANGTAGEATVRVPVDSGSAPTDSGSAPPPWQRVPADLAGHGDAGRSYPPSDEHGLQHSAGEPSGLGDPSAHQPTMNLGGTPSRPVVTGRAAPQSADAPTSVNRPLGGFAGTQSSSGGPSSVSARRPGRGPRRASLQVKRVDPWSVLKLALVLSVTLFLVWLVAVGVLYGVLSGMGVWDKLNGTYNELTQAGGTSGDQLITAGGVFSVATIIGVVNIVLFTALATLAAFIYNAASDLVGGIEVTLSERE